MSLRNSRSAALPGWLLGLLLCVLGSTLTALGLVVQKSSHVDGVRHAKGLAYYRQPLWVMGFSIFLIAQIINFVSMGWAPQVMLSALGAWSLVATTILAWAIVGERLQPLEVAAMLGIILGLVLVIRGTPTSDSSPHLVDVSQFVSTLVSFEFVLLVAGLVAFLGFSAFLSFKVFPGALPLFWAFVAAVLTGFAAMLFKCVSLLIVAAPPKQKSPWYRFDTYLILVAAAIFAVAEIHCLNIGLSIGDAVTVIPAYYSLGMLAQILSGALFFKELDSFEDWTQASSFWSGVAVLIVCIIWMTRLHICGEAESPDMEHAKRSVPNETTQLARQDSLDSFYSCASP